MFKFINQQTYFRIWFKFW